ncbi:hypothetical protein PEX1_006080 [Penicillium expansum]|uniref:Uncharacterized protein n=1 Tax=Penicillium expansum TaxID=27334 RepID=A0A0A2JSI0_PENEN|nr:hypothetical protein PEX2_020470 [Penicillium expansum]KGO44084.1 hypothetical protein PEXP_055390 [Penicillium expansum]KGO57603.1 hypothetical protein PEX2_020470 [Penicillium expansum]KGO69755.1 hypothetical protein PEX1_006080 [Penicillium expansum]
MNECLQGSDGVAQGDSLGHAKLMLVPEILGNVLCQHGFVTIETKPTLLVLLFTGRDAPNLA